MTTLIVAAIIALLPEGYSGNSHLEVEGWVSSARAKGFNSAKQLPLDEAVALAVAEELAPLKFSARDGFVHYDKGCWHKLPLNDVRRALKRTILALTTSKQLVASPLRSAEACLALNVEDENLGKPEGKICLRNGTLDLFTGKLLPHSPDHGLRYSLDFDWDPTATAPTYLEQLEGTLQHDEKAIAAFEEFAGLTLVSDQRFQKVMFLLGAGGSGKSTILRTIQMMQDPAAVSVTPLDKLEDERYRTEVAGKLVCISYDVQTHHRIFGETFIRVTGGDAIAIRRLYKEVDGMVLPTVRFIGSMNPDMPPYQAAPDALRRRLIFLPCGPRIESPDPDRQAKLELEKPGILVRWVAALNGSMIASASIRRPPASTRLMTI